MPMTQTSPNTLVILGPTASGKTTLGVQLARTLGGEILSADSRQVYQGLDIGSGKDLSEYNEGGTPVPYYLIDIVTLKEEYNLFRFQQDCYAAWSHIHERGPLPIIVGGTGLYLEAVLQGYRMVDAPENPALREELNNLDKAALLKQLKRAKPDLHNQTDTLDRDRTIRAIEIAVYSEKHPPPPAPDIRPQVLGIQWDRTILRQRITTRLKERMDNGLIEEVEALHATGYSWERLEFLGLEYRFISQLLQGKINNKNDCTQKLNAAIHQFAKRQETWFRRMERKGTKIHWVPEGALPLALAQLRGSE